MTERNIPIGLTEGQLTGQAQNRYPFGMPDGNSNPEIDFTNLPRDPETGLPLFSPGEAPKDPILAQIERAQQQREASSRESRVNPVDSPGAREQALSEWLAKYNVTSIDDLPPYALERIKLGESPVKINPDDPPIAYVKQVIEDIHSLEDMKKKLGEDGEVFAAIKRGLRNKTSRTKQNTEAFNAILRSNDLDQMKLGLVNLANSMIEEEGLLSMNERQFKLPQNIQQLFEELMGRETAEWKVDGKYELLNKKGEIQQQNFIRWVRKRMVYFHELNSDDPQNFFSTIRVPGAFRDLPLDHILDEKALFLKDEKTGLVQDELYERVLYEVWLFQTSRNHDVSYRFAMGGEESCKGELGKIYDRSVWTKPNALKTILTMPDLDKTEGGKWKEDNQETGKALRKALTAYFYLSDVDMLKKVLGEDSAMFNNNKFYELYSNLDKREEVFTDPNKATLRKEELDKKARDMIETALANDEKEGKVLFDDSGRAILWSEKDKQNFMNHVNIFNLKTPDTAVISEVRERIRMCLLDSGLTMEEVKYAENFAFSMTRWTGLAARNDTNAIGFDAWSKVMNTKEYRRRQSSPDRAAPYGNIYNLFGIKRLGLGMLESIQDESGKTMLEQIQGGQGADVTFEDIAPSDQRELRYKNNIMADYFVNHVAKTFDLFTWISESNEFNLDKIIKRGEFGRVIIDHHKLDEIKDKLFKGFRYAYSTWVFDYTKQVRVWDKKQVPGSHGSKTELFYDDLYLPQYFWNKEVLENFDTNFEVEENGKKVWKPGFENGKLTETGAQAIERGKKGIWKNPVLFILAAEIKERQDPHMGGEPLTYPQLEELFTLLSHIQGDISGDEDDMHSLHLANYAFTQDQLKRLEKKSLGWGGLLKLFLKELGVGLAIGVAEGTAETVEDVVEKAID